MDFAQVWTSRRYGLRAGMDLGAGIECRCTQDMAQVNTLLGAGLVTVRRKCDYFLGTCTAKWALMRSVGAGHTPFSTPAPKTPGTLLQRHPAKNTRHLRQWDLPVPRQKPAYGPWCRYTQFLAQVHASYGAGKIICGGPAPRNGLSCVLLAQVTTPFPHLHQKTQTPAPRNTETCAKNIPRSAREARRVARPTEKVGRAEALPHNFAEDVHAGGEVGGAADGEGGEGGSPTTLSRRGCPRGRRGGWRGRRGGRGGWTSRLLPRCRRAGCR